MIPGVFKRRTVRLLLCSSIVIVFSQWNESRVARKASVHKVGLEIADMDRDHYESYRLTVAQHPSETEIRLMVRLLGFAMYAHASLEFGAGLSSDEEPDLWQRGDAGEIELWIDLGQLDSKRIRKACGLSKRVVVVTYQERAARLWWQQVKADVARHKNLDVLHVSGAEALGTMVQRNMNLSINRQDGEIWLSDGERSCHLRPEAWAAASV